MVSYDLPAHPTSIRLNVDEGGWCSVQLVDDREIDIGSDLIGIICERLHKALVDPNATTVCGELNGKPVGWITAFAESHATLYVTVASAAHVTLFIQDRNLNIIGTVELSAEDRAKWCTRLSNIKQLR